MCRTLSFIALSILFFSPCTHASTVVVLDFENAPVGEFTSASPLVVSDNAGGTFVLTPGSSQLTGQQFAGTAFHIVEKNGDRELRLSDIGATAGSFVLDITHSGGDFEQISGGDYEALPGFELGNLSYARGTSVIFSDTRPVSTTEDTPITFSVQGSTGFARLSGNGLFLDQTDVMIDVDNLSFAVTAIPEPSIIPILAILSGSVLVFRKRKKPVSILKM